jgi:hypothetical protein
MIRKGFIARGVKIDSHTFGNRPANPEVPSEWFELTRPECQAMTPKLVGKPIIHWHNNAMPRSPPQVLGRVEAAGFNPQTGDWGISFRLNETGETALRIAGEGTLGLSLGHRPQPIPGTNNFSHRPDLLEPTEVSLTIDPARAGCHLIPSNDVRYNDSVFGKQN